jgi:hypothetical protein
MKLEWDSDYKVLKHTVSSSYFYFSIFEILITICAFSTTKQRDAALFGGYGRWLMEGKSAWGPDVSNPRAFKFS